MQFIGSLDLLRIWIAAPIWLSFLPAGFDSLAVGFATDAFFLLGWVAGALVAFAFGLATILVVLAIVLVFISRSPWVCVLFLSCDIHMKPCGWKGIKR